MGVSYEGAGSRATYQAGVDGISLTTEEQSVVGLSLEGDGMKVILADGQNTVPSSIALAGVNTNMDIYGHKNIGVSPLEDGLSIKTPVYAKGDFVSVNYTANTDTLIGYDTAVLSPFTGLKMAIITTGSSYGTYFSKVGGHWVFNGSLDTGIDSSSYPYMLQVTSTAVVSNWRGMGYNGIPSSWVGMWCACNSNGMNTSYYYKPTGIYGPNHTKKGDTIYFSV